MTWDKLCIISLGIGGIISLFASKNPDGLDRVAIDSGFDTHATSLFPALMQDYVFPGIQNPALATSLAGIAGTLTVFAILLLIGKILSRYTT